MEKASNNEPLISVIVPIYKVEDYLDKCVNSIINQTYQNLEIILVDDGSPDNCPKMCDEYAKQDNRIKVIHKKNGGLSDARNAGVKMATGSYITFVDSDDYISEDFIEYLFELSYKNNTLISVAPYIIVTDKKSINCDMGYKEEVLSQKEALKRMILDQGFTVSACSKLFSKALFQGIEFPKGRLFEDTATTYKLLLKCANISYGNKGGYYYYKRDNSIINKSFNRRQLDFIYYTDKMSEEILSIYPDLEESVESKKIDSRFSILRRMVLDKNLNKIDLQEKKTIIDYIKNKKSIIINGKFNKKIKIATILLMFGEKIFKIFWIIYSKIKYNM